MSNPQVYQGSLNRLLTGMVFPNYPALNVTAAYLSKEAISISFDGETAQLIPTLTGAVPSPEPYIFGTATIHLIRTQALANAFKQQIELNTILGPATVYPDSVALSPFDINNSVLQSVKEVTFDGGQVGLVVSVRGVYPINAFMFLSA